MSVWDCGANTCPGHSQTEDRCAGGVWRCSLVDPPCRSHTNPSDRCVAPFFATWSCGARDCPGHPSAAAVCSAGTWLCRRTTPSCAGHSAPGLSCRVDLSYAQQDCDQNFTPAAPTSTVQGCQTDDRVRLVELQEVVEFGGRQTRRAVAARHQFINLDAAVDPAAAHPEYGRSIKFQARVEWVSGDRSRPLTGQNVYWYASAVTGNKTGLAPADLDNFDSAGRGLITAMARTPPRKSTTTDASGWTSVVEYFLSSYGGDSFNVFATESPAYTGTGGLQAGPYQVWKKLWFQVTEMEDGLGGSFDLDAGVKTAYEAGYRTVFILFEEQLPRTRATHVGNLAGPAERAAASRPYFRVDAKCPFKAHIMTVDWSESGPVEQILTNTLRTVSYQWPEWIILWRHPGATLSGRGPGTLTWRIGAQWRPAPPAAGSPPATPTAASAWADIPDARLSTTAQPGRRGFKRITVDMSFAGAAGAPSATNPIEVRIVIRKAPGDAFGWGGGSHHLYLCSGLLHDWTPPADWVPIQRSDAVHEIGHALGLVNLPPTVAGAHSAWEDTSHPNHCTQPPTHCAMWWQSATNRLTTFHLAGGVGCHDHLRRQDFSRAVLASLWHD